MMINLRGLKCCIVAIVLYWIRHSPEDEFLKLATRVYNLKDLESKVLPLIVAVSGIVGSETNLIKCEHNDTLGVILEETVEQEFLKRKWSFSWVQYSSLMQRTGKEVPWYLDDGTGRVNVLGAHNATRLVLTFGSEVFEKAEQSSFFRRIFDNLLGRKMLGVRRIERVLKIGTNLTVVGEAIKDSIGNVKIRKPEQGVFYVTPIPFDQLISDPGGCLKYAYIGLPILGLILITKDVILYFIENAIEMIMYILTRRQRQRERERERDQHRERQVEWERERELERLRQERERERLRLEWERERLRLEWERERRLQIGRRVAIVNEACMRPELVTRGQDEKSDDLCVICLETKYDTVFLPCRHLCCCITCSSQVIICPLCRRQIDQMLNVFRH